MWGTVNDRGIQDPRRAIDCSVDWVLMRSTTTTRTVILLSMSSAGTSMMPGQLLGHTEVDSKSQKSHSIPKKELSFLGPVHTGRGSRNEAQFFFCKSFDLTCNVVWTLQLAKCVQFFCKQHLRAPPCPVWTRPKKEKVPEGTNYQKCNQKGF